MEPRWEPSAVLKLVQLILPAAPAARTALRAGKQVRRQGALRPEASRFRIPARWYPWGTSPCRNAPLKLVFRSPLERRPNLPLDACPINGARDLRPAPQAFRPVTQEAGIRS